MAELVAAIGVPHSPHYPARYPKDAPEDPARTYRAIKAQLDGARADAIVIIANDHFNTFFLDNFPTFAIGVAQAASGPNDETKMPRYDFSVQSELAGHVLKAGVESGFDFSVTRDFGVDHAMLVPLHYLTDELKTPVVPIWVNAFVKPLPSARRCYALGNMLKVAIDSLPRDMRVAVVASGSFSLEIAGPRVNPGERDGVPDIEWSKHLHRRIGNGEIDDIVVEATPERMWKAGNIGGELLNWIVMLGPIGKGEIDAIVVEATPERMWKAGNIGGELLNWIVMLGTIGNRKPSYLADHNDKDGHAFAAWSLN